MHYSETSSSVRVDRFKEGGKWYDTQAVDMGEHYNDPFIHEALKDSINEAHNELYVDSWLSQGGFFVCLEPYHKNAHPITLKD